jgi:hypothetical protein
MTFDPEVDQPLLPMFRSLRALTDRLDGMGHQIEVPRPQGANAAEYASCNVCGGGLTITVCHDCRAPRLEVHIRPSDAYRTRMMWRRLVAASSVPRVAVPNLGVAHTSGWC